MDTSALFSGIWSESGGARMILKLGEAEAIKIMVGQQVLAEIDEVLRAKYPQGMAGLARLLDRSRIEIGPQADANTITHCKTLMPHPGDALVLAEAWCTKVDYLATHDKAHFTENQKVLSEVPFLVGSPGDFLAWYRKRLTADE
jgi:predicted nucleic acid-binding protein